MIDRSKVIEALYRCTTQEWLKANELWSEMSDVGADPLLRFFVLQTAVRVGDGATAKAMADGLSPALMQYKFVAQIAADAEALSELQSTGIDEVEGDQRLLGRKLMEKSFFLRALDVWSELTDPAFAAERDLRLAKILYRLGEYESAAQHVEARTGGRYADRVEYLRQPCEASIQRLKRLGQRPMSFVAHPLMRELRTTFAEGEPTAAAATLALCLGTVTGDWSDFLQVLRRAHLAGSETILEDLADAQADDLADCIHSPQFAAVASPAFTDHLAKCCIQRGFYPLVDMIIDDIGEDEAPAEPARAAPVAPETQEAPVALATPPEDHPEPPAASEPAERPAPKKRAARSTTKRSAGKA
jgi:hypothetical protein